MREKPGGIVTGALFSILRKLSEARPKDSMTPATSFRNFRRVRPFQYRLKPSILQPAVSFFGLRAPLVSHLSYRYCLQFRSLIREELKFLSKLISSSRRVSLTSLFLLFPVRWVMERLRQLPISSFIYFRMRWRYQQVPALSILFIPVGYQQRSSRNGKSCSLRRVTGSMFALLGLLKALLWMRCEEQAFNLKMSIARASYMSWWAPYR